MPKEFILASSLVSAKIHLRFVARAILERNEIVGDTAPRSTLAILGCCVPIIDANFFWDKFSSMRTPSISNPMFIFSSIYVQLSEGGDFYHLYLFCLLCFVHRGLEWDVFRMDTFGVYKVGGVDACFLWELF